MVSRDKILSLLGSGLPAETVALAVGCDPSYISQLLADETFREEVQLARLQNLTEATDRDKKYDQIEDELLGKLKDSIGFLIKPRDILTALAIINRAERRGAPPIEQTLVNNTIVNLTLPQKVRMEFTVNSDKQVVAVNERSMLTLESNRLTSLAQAVKEQQQLAQPQKVTELPTKPTEKAQRDETSGVSGAYPKLLKRERAGDSSELSDEELLQALS